MAQRSRVAQLIKLSLLLETSASLCSELAKVKGLGGEGSASGPISTDPMEDPSISLSLFPSHTHTHTHIHTLSL